MCDKIHVIRITGDVKVDEEVLCSVLSVIDSTSIVSFVFFVDRIQF